MADKILIVDDDEEIREVLRVLLTGEGFDVAEASGGEEALACLEAWGGGVELVILDVMLPGMDGLAVCKRIRDASDTPILMVSAKNQKQDQLSGIVLGADDYIEKPYDIDILLAKISNIFRRRYAQDEIVDGDLRLDKIRRTVYKGSILLELTAKEFDLLQLFMEQKGKVLRKEYLFEQVWGLLSVSEPQTLTVHVKWLRQKIEEDPKHPKRIVTVWGVGYQFL